MQTMNNERNAENRLSVRISTVPFLNRSRIPLEPKKNKGVFGPLQFLPEVIRPSHSNLLRELKRAGAAYDAEAFVADACALRILELGLDASQPHGCYLSTGLFFQLWMSEL